MALPSASTPWLVDLTAVLSDVRFCEGLRTLRDVRLDSASEPKADIDTPLFPALNLPLVIKK
jgi:hypothetical protein